ncbi:acyl dehydratase [Streptomyces sp. NBC_00038]|uniref:acyl dehydratase n=1 Tax=Streptomyces sp. NBC_00038 TaxID=2903615 RepID=UPI002B1E61AA|nr:acyl dehydratase [Streptomyces sp. NBC_00038]
MTTTTVQLFRFSAVTWNAHRIHYDTAYARSEGYPDVLVQSHLHGCFLANAVLAWAGPDARLQSLRWENRAIAIAGNTLTVTGTITASRVADGRQVIEVDLEERDQYGALCTPGHAVVVLPVPRPVGRSHQQAPTIHAENVPTHE